jgi:predicted DCC family thiol-disulfide oxidoreductase YuxK
VAKESLLIFDGDCGFCTTAVGWLRQHLPAMPEATPYQWADLAAYGLTTAEASAKLQMVVNGRAYAGHLAVSAMLRHQPSAPWRFAGWLLASPPFSPIAAAGYSIIARYRHLLPGGTPACAMKPVG